MGGKAGVVGVSLHFGPVATLPYWLRAHGIVQTSVRTDARDSLKGLTNFQFSLSPPVLLSGANTLGAAAEVRPWDLYVFQISRYD